jgi:protocatechuate 3,4-dioxygenase beta subunit
MITRRSLLRHLGKGVAVAPLAAHMLACSDEGDQCVVPAEWASGGTVAMTSKDCYPDPFAAGVLTCALLCGTTEGPCTAEMIERQDVSEGWAGLPVRLALQFVDADTCKPVQGAIVEIWHTQRTGVYSGVTPVGAVCYGDDPDAESYLYFRGSQTTDAAGRVDFDTCYPGWYPGRAIHIHFRVVLDGQTHLISQLFFTDELSEEIFAEHPDYVDFGSPDTSNSIDNVIGGENDLSPYLLDTERMADGAMLAWKLVAIRSSPSDALCEAQGTP